MCHTYTTIFCYTHCVPLSIFNMLTQPFFVVEVNGEKWKVIDILQMAKDIVMVFAQLLPEHSVMIS